MASEVKVIDNFIPESDFKLLQEYMLNDVRWAFAPWIADKNNLSLNQYQFCHVMYYPNVGILEGNPKVLSPIVERLTCKYIMRVKANLQTYTPELVINDWHIDMDYNNKTAIYYVNTCDGYTEFEETGQKVESIRNRIVIFDGSMRHRGTTTTNSKIRMLINFNYIPAKDPSTFSYKYVDRMNPT